MTNQQYKIGDVVIYKVGNIEYQGVIVSAYRNKSMAEFNFAVESDGKKTLWFKPEEIKSLT